MSAGRCSRWARRRSAQPSSLSAIHPTFGIMSMGWLRDWICSQPDTTNRRRARSPVGVPRQSATAHPGEPDFNAILAKEAAMEPIIACKLPDGALLHPYLRNGAYTDCYVVEVAGRVSHPEYVEAFYTTPLFKLERLILSWFAARPSTDAQARELAVGERSTFAAWSVEERKRNQILLSDFRARTRSWLMVARGSNDETTRLYFGSAVVPRCDTRSGDSKMGFTFEVLLGFHKLYSRALLRAALTRLKHAPSIKQNSRPARFEDCATIAALSHISSGGVTDYLWTKVAEPGEEILAVGQGCYERGDSGPGYRNCTIIESEGSIIGMLVAFPVHSNSLELESDPVLAPYSELREDDSYYILDMAIVAEHRDRGIGKRILALAEEQARDKGFRKISLMVFEQNTGAKLLYERSGFKEARRVAVCPHPLIHYSGDAILMVKRLDTA